MHLPPCREFCRRRSLRMRCHVGGTPRIRASVRTDIWSVQRFACWIMRQCGPGKRLPGSSSTRQSADLYSSPSGKLRARRGSTAEPFCCREPQCRLSVERRRADGGRTLVTRRPEPLKGFNGIDGYSHPSSQSERQQVSPANEASNRAGRASPSLAQHGGGVETGDLARCH